MSLAPVLPDPRDTAAIEVALRARVPGYLPAWTAAAVDETAGAALLRVLARYRAIFAEGLNAAPARVQLAFLETLGNSLLPGQPARVPLVFELLATSPQDVFLTAHSQVAAKLPPPPALLTGETEAGAATRDAPRYFTTRSVALSRARLAALYSADPRVDAYADHTAAVRTGFTAFERLGGMGHTLYLGHGELFSLAGTAEVNLSFDMAGEGIADRLLMLEWEYLSTDGWLPLTVEEDTTARCTVDGRIRLRKNCGPDSKRDTLFGADSYWIRASAATAPAAARVLEIRPKGLLLDRAGALLPGDIVTVEGQFTARVTSGTNRTIQLDANPPGLREDVLLRVFDITPPLGAETEARLGPPPRVDLIRARVGFSKSDLKPDQAFAGSAPVDLDNVFYPFGLQPVSYATFYLACDDAFSRKGAAVEIAFTFKQVGKAGSGGLTLAYEYFDGSEWSALSTSLPVKLDDVSDRLQQAGAITFNCPEDWAQNAVNGRKHYWMRLRIDAGDYGAPVKLAVVDDGSGNMVVSATPSDLKPPVLASIRISYTYFTNSRLLDYCYASNNFITVDHSEDCRWTRRPFSPFLHNADRDPSLNFGFDQKLPPGLVSLYVHGTAADGAPAASPFIWEYRVAEGWNELTVLDESAGLRRPGMIQFIGPSDAEPADGLGGRLYRVRARLKPGERLEPAPVSGLWTNAVWGAQGEAVSRETIGRSDGNPDQVLSVPPQRIPVLSGELVEVREWAGRGEGWRSAVDGVAEADLRFERDPVSGDPRAVWVRWSGREHLLESGPDDRHYALERTRGRVIFGDDVCGRIPPGGAAIALSFITGIGEAGNVPAHTITELRTGAAYLQSVDNPVAADGGVGPEALDAVIDRASFRLRHRGRAVAADDYAWLAREASPMVARARCLRVTDAQGRARPGAVTVVIVPRGSTRQPQPGAELRRRVREMLVAVCPPAVAARLRVSGPRYVAVGVLAHVVLAEVEAATSVEAALREQFDRWLHPVNGGPEGRGWPFGASLCLSHIAALIEATPSLDHAVRLAFRADGASAGDVLTLPPDALPAAGLHEIKLELTVAGG
ncbi:MAG: putative baseplate assembly protein [Rhodanobacteraceae bacterium]|nr:putative baseplate assembly protein [Rhodanobacteraceae bacterium]